MLSNSKLTPAQKQVRKANKAELIARGGAIVTSSDGSVTLAFAPEFKGSRMLAVGVSVASPNERKIRAKVGEFHALDNWVYGDMIKVPDGVDMHALADVIADH